MCKETVHVFTPSFDGVPSRGEGRVLLPCKFSTSLKPKLFNATEQNTLKKKKSWYAYLSLDSVFIKNSYLVASIPSFVHRHVERDATTCSRNEASNDVITELLNALQRHSSSQTTTLHAGAMADCMFTVQTSTRVYTHAKRC